MKEMKNIVYLFLLITQTFWAQSAFEKGNTLYQKEIIKMQSLLMKVL